MTPEEIEQRWAQECDFPPEHLGRIWLAPGEHHGVAAVHFSKVEAKAIPPYARAYVREDIASAEAERWKVARDAAVRVREEELTHAHTILDENDRLREENEQLALRLHALRQVLTRVELAVRLQAIYPAVANALDIERAFLAARGEAES